VGKIIDRLGTKLGYLLAMVCWSLSGALTGLSRSVVSLGFWQGMLGITESGNFPAAIKAVAEWFHPKQRALATSLFNSGPHISLVVCPPLIAILTLWIGWRWTFAVFGLAGIALGIVWHFAYRFPTHLDPAAASSGTAVPSPRSVVRWRDLLKDKRIWGIMIGRFCGDPVWWFYIFWLPPYLYDQHGFNIKEIGFAMPLIYGAAILLSNVAGWYTGRLIGHGWSDYKARKMVMFLCAMCLPITALSAVTSSPWVVIAMVSLVAGAHSGWAANIFSLASDCFPSSSVASVTGLSGCAGGLGGIIFSSFGAGLIVEYFGYVPLFVLMGFMHPFAILCIHLLVKEKTSTVNA
jgi:ACS family hexuronate transporter-like MFS transporter